MPPREDGFRDEWPGAPDLEAEPPLACRECGLDLPTRAYGDPRMPPHPGICLACDPAFQASLREAFPEARG